MSEEKKFNFKNVKLNYIKGPDSGLPLVLLHGLSDRWQSYLSLIPFLCPYYTIYALDLRGHGKSYRANSYKIIDYAYDIELFLANLFDKPVFMVGQSLGAAISLYIAAKYPERCMGLGLLEPFIFSDRLDDDEFRKYFIDCLDVCTRYKSIDLIRKNIKENGILAEKRATDLIQLDKKTIKAVLNKKVFDGFDLDGLLSEVSCPVMVLRGNPGLDGFITEDKASYLKERINNCVVEYIERGSHIVHIDRPLETAGYILKFLTSV